MIPDFLTRLPLAALLFPRWFCLGLFGSGGSKQNTNINQTEVTYGPQGDNGLQGNRNSIGNTTTKISGNVGNTSGDGNFIMGAGSTYVENLDEGLARFVVEKNSDLAGNVASSAYDFAKLNATLGAQQNARFFDFFSEQNALTESTRVGNQQLAADMTARALELAEKRTGSDSDKAAETVSSLVRLAVIAAAVLGALFLLFRRK